MRLSINTALAMAVLTAGLLIGTAAPARATFELSLQEDGGAITQVATGADFTPLTFSGTFGDFAVTFFGATSTNSATLSDIMSSTTTVLNSSGMTHTLAFYVSQQDFTLPTSTSLNVESGLGGSLVAGTYQAYADQNNNLNGTSDFTNGLQTATLIGATFATGSANGLFTRIAGSPYSLTSVATFTLDGSVSTTFADNVNVTAVPAPAGMVLALTSLPFLGIGAWLRRRKTSKVPVAA
jgi:hypothetical protein